MSKSSKMRELYDPVYYPPNIQGSFNDPYQYRTHHQLQQQTRPTTSSSKSSSSSSVLGRFLKLGKSKSDASLSGNNGGYTLSTARSSSGIGGGRSTSCGDELDDFRLPQSVIARGPVEKMVHKANSRKDVSRSHSWIYGSVKLPSDLPFGYGEQFSFHEDGGGEGELEEQQRSNSSGHYLHTHSLHSMQIPRCQLDYYCTCDCGGDDRGGMMMSPSGRPIAGGSVRAGGGRRKPPCQGCAREMAMAYALPSTSGKRKSGGGSDGESFVSSVRKLTWKSLKQVVKKRPSLDTLKKMPSTQQQLMQSQSLMPSEYLSTPIVPMPYLSPSAVAAASATSVSAGIDMIPPLSPTVNANPMANLMNSQSHYGNPHHNQSISHPSPHNGAMTLPHSPNPHDQTVDDPHHPNYFFPEKKGFYASCNDIYAGEPPPHVTASVRVRPKPTRQPWQFPSAASSSEFGPIPNYEEETDQQQLYHSEWDLRHVMTYDMWMNTTSNVKPRTAVGPSSGGSGSISSKSSKSHSAERERPHHSQSSGNIHLPPPDYAPSEPTTFRPQQQHKSHQSRSSPNLDKIISSKSSSNGSVKMMKSSSSTTSHRSLASLHSPSAASTSSKRSIKSSQSSDTLSISTFAGTPSNPTKSKDSSPSNGIVKRSSILAADVTAYQLLKAQTKKGKPPSAVDGGVQPSTQVNARSVAISSKKQQKQPDLDDAFSESSDDLSDNAITGSSDHASTSSANSAKNKGSSGPGVRIAGQGIRVDSSKRNNLKANSKATTVMSPAIIGNSNKGQNRPSTFTNYQSNQQSNNRNQQRNSACPTSNTNKNGLKAIKTNSSRLGPTDEDVWSDCHNESETMRRKAMGLAIVENHHPPNKSQHVLPSSSSGGSRDRSGELTSSHKSVMLPSPSSIVSMKVSGQISSSNNNQTQKINHQQANGGGMGGSRPTFVTFESKPQKFQDDMDFEEYEFDDNVINSREQEKSSGTNNPTSAVKMPSLANLKSSSDNVVSLNVTRSPMNNNDSTSSGASVSPSPQHHPTYIKKGQQSSPSSVAATGKFGALRRRKSRSGSNTSPGKLLQETIYEEDVEQIDDFNNVQSSKGKVSEHSVKIMVSQNGNGGGNNNGVVKPILKNRERTYETPVTSHNTSQNTNFNSSGSCSDSQNSSKNFGMSSHDSSSTQQINTAISASLNNNDIYFDSSVSTVSTASKKKVQFDQKAEVVVCGGDSSGQESYDEENDDSDQWSNKSEDEEMQQCQQQITSSGNNSVDTQESHNNHRNSASAHNYQHHQLRTGPTVNGCQNGDVSSSAKDGFVDKKEQERVRSSFEEEVIRKAEAFAKSRRETEAKKKEAEKELDAQAHSKKNEDVNNLPNRRYKQNQPAQISSMAAQRKTAPVLATTGMSNGGCSAINNKPTTNSQGRANNGIVASANNSSSTRTSPVAVSSHNKANSKNGHVGVFDSNKTNGEIGGPSNRILNPNSLLFHDTTRIRLNQSRPALHESTFKLPNGNGSPTSNKRGTRLKQSNSFRSVSSLTLRPKEPPPPPPVVQTSGKSALSSVPARLQKALSTSTLLSKSTEKLNLNSSLSSKSIYGSASSHYGPGGKLLPTKSQISLPLGFTTTSKTAGLLASGSVDKLNLGSSPKESKKPISTSKGSGGVKGRLSKSTASLATRSKSLTDRCEALEKVLNEQKKEEMTETYHLRRSTPALNTISAASTLPKDDIDSKNIEIVTKENSVSEIRIYSASSTSGLSIHPAENLAYQGIIYESTKTIITAPEPAPLPPPHKTEAKHVPVSKQPEIHYAATDLFTSPSTGKLPPVPKRQPPFSHPPLPPIPTEEETTGKSVVLIIDNSNKASGKKPSIPPRKDESTLPAYSQPIDTISSAPPTMPNRCALPPQIPLPSIPQKDFAGDMDDLGEPLYDDVVNNSADPPLPQLPGKLNGMGSTGRKSIGSLISSLPHKLGELPPLPPPPVPPHRTPILPTSGQVVSSTLPCPACPPSLPPPNLPSKSLSEFHNRPLIIQESEEDSIINHGFPAGGSLDEEVDNLYNDIGTPTTTSLPTQVSGSQTMKSNTAAAFASAMKEAFLGAISNKSNKDYDRRSVQSVSSNSSCKQSGDAPAELIYDDTLSVISSSSAKTRLINHHNQQKTEAQQLNPLPLPPQSLSNKLATSAQKEKDDDIIQEADNEPLYDDVLNLTGNDQEKKDEKKMLKENGNGSGAGSEYHSSNASDSGTEDLPPPLPTQGPPALPKGGAELPLLTFPLLNALPIQASNVPSNIQVKKKEEVSSTSDESNESDRTRSLLTELNEKLSKLNFPAPTSSNTAPSTSPGSSSLSSAGTTGAGEGQDSSDFSSFHISKVVISPSSESSGVEEDYNSEKNYSLSNGSDATSSGGGSDNENYNNSNKSLRNSGNNEKGASAPASSTSGVSTASAKLASAPISVARGKFLENMKLSMLSSMASGTTGATTGSGLPQGLLMMTTNSTVSPFPSKNVHPAEDEDEEEPIYEEIGENHQHHSLVPKVNQKSSPKTAANEEEVVDEEDDDNRSTSPVYADAFDAKSMFDGASRNDILTFLESIRDRLTGAESTSSSESQSSSISRSSTATGASTKKSDPVASVAEDDSEVTAVEENNVSDDVTGSSSGLSEMQIKAGESPVAASPLLLRRLLCPDCNDDIQLDEEEGGEDLLDRTVNTGVAHPPSLYSEEEGTNLNSGRVAHVCRSCNRKRNEKKEIIMEIYETELKYGRDLRIVSEEFYKPIQIAGLLTKEQLDQIFLNVDQLIQLNLELTGRLKAAIQQTASKDASGKSEESLGDVNVGKIFLELGETMMTAFESYCTRQASAGALLSQLEKEKELLRIFLRVSQMENTVLRRMNLPAFLMVPVQRVTRYPLLLSRLLKVTPVDHFSRDELQLAQEKVEQHLEHMNKTTREVASVKLWRRISIINGNSSSNNNSNSGPAHRRSNSDLDTSNIRIRKMAMDVLDWANFNDVTCVIDNQLGSVHFNGKILRNLYGCVLARGKDMESLASKIQDQDPFFPPAEDVVKDVKLVLVRVKNTRFCLLREPLCLSKCVVSQGENEFQDFIEINEITTKNTYFIQGLDKQGTATWLKLLQCYSACVGHWRRRRPALANIMMNGMIKHL